jgi:ATP-dependent helicase/nuclease subunit A
VSEARRAFDDELRQSDQRARELAQREFDRPLVLEAGAGTGKTTALVARVLAWCLGPGWARAEQNAGSDDERARDDRTAARVLRGVAAITFTEKAAAEMGERIAASLLAIECGDSPSWLLEEVLSPDRERQRGRARALRGAFDHLAVQTIHAYCRQLLIEHSLDAGLHPSFEVDADKRAQAEAVRSAIEIALRTAYVDPADSDFAALAARGIGPREIEAELLALFDAGLPSAVLAAEPAAPTAVKSLIERFREKLGVLANATGGCLIDLKRVSGATEERLDETLRELTEKPPADRADLMALIGWLQGRWADNERNRLKDWGKGNFTKGEAGALGEGCGIVSAAARELALLLEHILAVDLDLLDTARNALRPLMEAAEAQLRSTGAVGFAALLSGARTLLCERPDVAARVRSGIDQLLVDEFQDTDRRQCDIIRALALQGDEGERPGLFLVGDPKQSIYGWRNADLAAYDAFISGVIASGGLRERLSVNYRSVPDVLEEVERVIAPIMEEHAGLQPRFQPLIPASTLVGADGFRAEGRASVEYWISVAWDFDASQPRPTRAREASELEASALARDLRELHDRSGVSWPSIGVLFRGRSDWEIYLSALREANIPFAVEGDRSYYRRREIIEAASLVRCVLDPNDQLALLTYLRSAAVGVPDAALLPLWLRHFPALLRKLEEPRIDALVALGELIRAAASATPADVPGLARIHGWEENLLSAVADLAHLRASFATEPADVFVEKLRTRTLFEVTEAARYLGAWRCANLERFFQEISEALCEGQNVHELLRGLRKAVASEEHAEEGQPAELAADSVKVMTIHGAKGLDFEHVYLMQLHKGSRGGSDLTADGAEVSDGYEYRLSGAPSLAWDCVRQERERVSEAERVRLLYVAMTRAKHRLVLAGLPLDYQLNSSSGQPIELTRHRIESAGSFDGLLRGVAEKGTADFIDDIGVRWWFPALEPRAEDRLGGAALQRLKLPTESEIAQASQRLAELKTSAVERMGRPLGAAASARAHDELADLRVERFQRPAGSRDAAVARTVGTAIHRVLEEFDFGADLDAEWERQRNALARDLALDVSRDARGTALEASRRLLDRIATGSLFERLRALADRIVARELSVLLPPAEPNGPVGYLAGVIDLVYRDPDSGELVVADYKTDSLPNSAAAQQRVAAYAGQGAVYQRAIREALDLSYTPRFELWFLDADQIADSGHPSLEPA